MIYLAIDEVQRAESREQNMADAIGGAWPQPFSALSLHLSTLPEPQYDYETEEARLERVHLQAERVDE